MIRKWLVIFISLTPWVVSLFLHYWLEYEKVWSVDMPYRALVSAILIFFGMALSFFLHSWLVGVKGSR
tara:strand:- start:1010 stop:1213 length:204 start_codon:yes stop_codon:yes gene_type:complete